MDDSLTELSELATTAGGEVVGDGIQKLATPCAATYIGKGKAEEFAKHCQRADVDTVIFDDELSPAQSRNLEKAFNCKILDRTSLILDIFAQRARTREGKLQIELAQLQHLLPRLTRFWGHLTRQKGGIGMRSGEGETQLETDRRRVQDRIARIPARAGGGAPPARDPAQRAAAQPLGAGLDCRLHQRGQVHAAEYAYRRRGAGGG